MPRKRSKRPNPFAPPYPGGKSDIDPAFYHGGKGPRNLNPDDYEPMPMPHPDRNGTREFKGRMYRERLKPRSKDAKWTAKGYKAGTFRKRKKKPSAVLIGRDKGMYRKTDTGYKKRRFTFKQRQTFRAKKGPVFGGPKDGRPSA